LRPNNETTDTGTEPVSSVLEPYQAVVTEVGNTTPPADYEAWRQLYGDFSLTKPEGMDTNTWQVGQALYNLYNANQQSNTNYQSQVGQINTQEDFQNQQAYILSQKVLKYLQLGNQAQGMQGVAAGDRIALQNNYLNQLGAIGTEYGNLRNEANSTLQSNNQTANQTAQSQLSSIYGNQALQEQQTAATEEAQVLYNQQRIADAVAGRLAEMAAGFNVDEATGNYSYEDYKQLEDCYNANKDRIDVSSQEYIDFILQNNYPHNEEGTATGTTEMTEVLDGRRTTTFNGVEYKVTGVKMKAATKDLPGGVKNGDIIDYTGYTGSQFSTKMTIKALYYDGYLYEVSKVG